MYKVGLADALLPLPGCLGCFRLLPVDRVGEGVAGPAAVDKAILMGSAASHPSIWVSHSLCLPIARPSSTRSWHSASRRAMCAWNEHLHFPVFVTSYTQRQLPRRGLPHARTHAPLASAQHEGKGVQQLCRCLPSSRPWCGAALGWLVAPGLGQASEGPPQHGGRDQAEDSGDDAAVPQERQPPP